MQDTEKCASENNKYMKATIRKPDTKKHKATAKQVKLKATIHYTESLESICYIAIIIILRFSAPHAVMPEQGQIQVLWGQKLIQFWGSSIIKRIENHEYKISYESEYLFIQGNKSEHITNLKN